MEIKCNLAANNELNKIQSFSLQLITLSFLLRLLRRDWVAYFLNASQEINFKADKYLQCESQFSIRWRLVL